VTDTKQNASSSQAETPWQQFMVYTLSFPSSSFMECRHNLTQFHTAPVTLPPCPLMVFKRADTMTTEEGTFSSRLSFSLSDWLAPGPLPAGGQTVGGHWLAFVASGYLLSVDPDRILLSRIILTGYPFKVHKSGAVIKHMFHNPGKFTRGTSQQKNVSQSNTTHHYCRGCAVVQTC